MSSQAADPLLARVRKLLAKAEDAGVTAAEAQALTAKAAELMAKYGIDRALLAAERPETDRPTDRVIDVGNPWARVQAHLLCGLASALRCQCVILPRPGPGARIHMFGFSSDLERTDVLYTSLLVQMWQGLAAAQVPAGYLEAILTDLRRAGLVCGRPGYRGGFALERAPEAITVAEILAAVDCPLVGESHALDESPVVGLWRATESALRTILKEWTLADLACC